MQHYNLVGRLLELVGNNGTMSVFEMILEERGAVNRTKIACLGGFVHPEDARAVAMAYIQTSKLFPLGTELYYRDNFLFQKLGPINSLL